MAKQTINLGTSADDHTGSTPRAAGTIINANFTEIYGVNGILKSNGSTTLSAAVSGTDYAPATSGTSILYGNGSGGFSNVTIGSGLSFSTGTLSASGGGTVTSVGVTVPSILSVSGSPVTTSGTIAISLATQIANTVFAGPTTGSAATPTFRALVLNDLPSGVGLTASTLAQFAATTSSQLAGVISDETGSGSLVFATSPTLVTPVIGVASATSINKVTITAPATGSTLTIPDGVTLTGPASSGTAMTLGNTETVTGVKTFGSAGAVGRFKIAGTTSGSTILDASAVASGTLTLPAATDTLVGRATTDTLTNKSIAGSQITGAVTGLGTTMSTATLLGRNTAGTGAIEEISPTTAKTMLSLVPGTNVEAYRASAVQATLSIVIDGGGSAISTGVKGDSMIPWAYTITSWDIVADQSGSIVIDLWKDTYANFPPTVADTITGSAKPTLSSAVTAQSSTLTGWTTTGSRGDYIRWNVDSASTVTRAVLTLYLTRS